MKQRKRMLLTAAQLFRPSMGSEGLLWGHAQVCWLVGCQTQSAANYQQKKAPQSNRTADICSTLPAEASPTKQSNRKQPGGSSG
jgi:hypothetical protein